MSVRAEFLDAALACGAVLTGKPDGSEAITVVFTIQAWRAFDLVQQPAAVVSLNVATWSAVDQLDAPVPATGVQGEYDRGRLDGMKWCDENWEKPDAAGVQGDIRKCCGSEEVCDRMPCPARPGWQPDSGRDAALEMSDAVRQVIEYVAGEKPINEWDSNGPDYLKCQACLAGVINNNGKATPDQIKHDAECPFVAATKILAAHPAPSSDAALVTDGNVHAKIELFGFNTEDVRLVISSSGRKHEVRMCAVDARFIVEAVAEANRAAHPAPSSDAALVRALKDIADACNCCGDRNDLSQIAQDALDVHPANGAQADKKGTRP